MICTSNLESKNNKTFFLQSQWFTINPKKKLCPLFEAKQRIYNSPSVKRALLLNIVVKYRLPVTNYLPMTSEQPLDKDDRERIETRLFPMMRSSAQQIFFSDWPNYRLLQKTALGLLEHTIMAGPIVTQVSLEAT